MNLCVVQFGVFSLQYTQPLSDSFYDLSLSLYLSIYLCMKSEINFYFLKTFSGTCSVFVFSDHYIVSLFSLLIPEKITLG